MHEPIKVRDFIHIGTGEKLYNSNDFSGWKVLTP